MRKTYADFVEKADYQFLQAVMRRAKLPLADMRLFAHAGRQIAPALGFQLHPTTDVFCLKAGLNGLNTRVLDKNGYTLREKDWSMAVTPADVFAWIGEK